MRPLRLGGLLVATALLVGSACGSAAPERKVEAASAIPTSAHHGWRELEPTTTTQPPAPPPVVTAPKAPQRAAAPRVSRGSSPGSGWEALRQCENGGSYAKGSSPGFFGAYQFDRGTWYANNVAGGEWGSASPEQQDAAAQHLYSQRGAQPWPVCGAHLR